MPNPTSPDPPGKGDPGQQFVRGGTKALLDATFDGYLVAETVLAERLLPSFTAGMLVMADRNFLSWPLWRKAVGTGTRLGCDYALAS